MAGTRTLDLPAVLRADPWDATALLTLRCLRVLAWSFLWVGLLVAGLVGQAEDLDELELDTFGDYISSLWSPLAGLVLFVGLRFAVGGLALVFAYPAAHAIVARYHAEGHGLSNRLAVWSDRLSVTRGLRALRWSSPVASAAVVQLGPAGARIATIERAVRVGNVLLFVVAVISLVLFSGTVELRL